MAMHEHIVSWVSARPILSRWFTVHSEDADVRRRGLVLLVFVTFTLGLVAMALPLPLLTSPEDRLQSYGLIVGTLCFYFFGGVLARRGWVNAAGAMISVCMSTAFVASAWAEGAFITPLWAILFSVLLASFAVRPWLVVVLTGYIMGLLFILMGHFGSEGLLDEAMIENFVTLLTIMFNIGVVGFVAASVNSIVFASLGEALERAELAQLKAEAAGREADRAREVAETASRAKSRFLANMSHELRTPLNAIIGYSEMLREDLAFASLNESLESTSEDLERIGKAGHHLLLLINDVLDLSKIEAGGAHLTIDRVELDRLIEEVDAACRYTIESRGNTLEINIEPGARELSTDETKLKQVMINLLSNAGKFTQNGTIVVRLSPATLDGAQAVAFEVRDTGIGMSAEQQSRVFEAFEQADVSTTREYGGTGLGLTLVRHLVGLLGGTLDLESAPGEGSRFVVTLPTHELGPTERVRAHLEAPL